MGTYELEFYRDSDDDDGPVLRWLREELSPSQRLIVGTAMREVLEKHGISVCGTEFGKALGEGLFEFRVRGNLGEFVGSVSDERKRADEKILIRVFCHAHGDRVILLLGGYDKLAHPSKSHQNGQINVARRRLAAWKLAQKVMARARPKSP